MARDTKNAKTRKSLDEQLYLESLHANNHNPFWQSTLFDEVYLQNDVPVKHRDLWEQDEAGPFFEFCAQFQSLCSELKNIDLGSWSERNTINRIIKPVLRMLGYFDKCSPNQEPWAEDESFSLKEDGELKTYKPDLIIVNDPRELQHIERKRGQEKLEEARESVIVPIEAKYWDRIEDIRQNSSEDTKRADKKDQSDSARALDFEEQCLKYMEILHKDYGILTDGRTWRLYNFELSSGSYHRNFQFNLGHLMRHVNAGLDKDPQDDKTFRENAKYFYHLFCKRAFYNEEGNERLLDSLLSDSKKYGRVEEDLKDRFVKAISFACNGFLKSAESKGLTPDVNTIRNVAESHLFNILFIKHCESRNVLPLKQSPEYRAISLSNTVDKLEHFRPTREEDDLNLPALKRMFSRDFTYSQEGTELYDRLLQLTSILQSGSKKHQAFEIEGFQESIFSEEEWNFAQKHKLSNLVMVRVLFELGYCKSEIPGKRYQQIPYNFFSPRQLGSIYESFLGFRLERASESMAYIKKQWVPANLQSEKMKALDVPKVRKGELFFSPDNADRKATGSYYTPDSVVQYIVKETLAPLVKNKKSQEILKLRVCDPAMGSGHFVSAALTYLSRRYLEALEKETNDDLTLTLIAAKRKLLPHCIYGVDINPRAVKLAKMSLWLESAEAGRKLEHLDDQIECTDSLNDESLWRTKWRFLNNGIDAVVGNPPYLGEKGHKDLFQKLASGFLGRRFYMGKCDLFYFFFHIGLEILRDGGRLGFITTNYFTTAQGAKNLRKDLKDRSNIDLLINLNELKVFGDASGQHNMITVLTKTEIESETVVVNSDETGPCTQETIHSIASRESKKTTYSLIQKTSLFDGEEFYIRIGAISGGADTSQFKSVIAKIRSESVSLGSVFNVNQGIVSGADKVSEAHRRKFPNIKSPKGAGIFVLSRNELKSLSFKKPDADLLVRSWFKNSHICKFGTEKKSDEYVLYVGREQKSLPKEVIDFLSPYKTMLAARREVKNDVIKWFQLQWPRDRTIFECEKIVAPQRSKLNTFGYNKGNFFASADVYFITKTDKSPFSIQYLLGILNSRLFFSWLYLMGKRKGEALELYQKPLSEVPLKKADKVVQKEIEAVVETLIEDPSNAVAFNTLNDMVNRIYNLTKPEIKLVNALYAEKSLRTEVTDEEEKDE